MEMRGEARKEMVVVVVVEAPFPYTAHIIPLSCPISVSDPFPFLPRSVCYLVSWCHSFLFSRPPARAWSFFLCMLCLSVSVFFL